MYSSVTSSPSIFPTLDTLTVTVTRSHGPIVALLTVQGPWLATFEARVADPRAEVEEGRLPVGRGSGRSGYRPRPRKRWCPSLVVAEGRQLLDTSGHGVGLYE